MTEKISKSICRFCLAAGDVSISPLNLLLAKKLSVVVPGLKVVISTELVICSKCQSLVEEFYKWKWTFQCNATTQKDNFCFICSENFRESGKRFRKDNDFLFSSILQMCVPQLGQYCVEKIVICETCYNTLRKMYFFNHKCLSIQNKIDPNYKFKPIVDINLSKVLSSTTEDSNNLRTSFDFDVDNEKEEMNFKGEQKKANNCPRLTGSHNENKRKYSPTEEADSNLNASCEPPNKENQICKCDPNRLLYDDLPLYGIHFKHILRPKNGVTMDEWLERVEKIREQNGWSIEFTRKKVLTRLKSLELMYDWVADLTKEMNWEDMKYTLISAFPGKKDFGLNITLVVHMHKSQNASYVNFFNRKMALLQHIDVSDKEAVSLISAGIQDSIIKSEARAICRTPAELLEYFKQCDGTNSRDEWKFDSICKWCFGTTKCKAGKETNEGKKNMTYIEKEKLSNFSKIETLNSARSNTMVEREFGSFYNSETHPSPSPLLPECHHCNKIGHLEIDCPLNSFSKTGSSLENSDVICSFCRVIGHRTPDCPNNISENSKKRRSRWKYQ